jgi:hypothetical protein
MTEFFSHVMEHYIEVILAAVLIAALALSWRLIAALAAFCSRKRNNRGVENYRERTNPSDNLSCTQ